MSYTQSRGKNPATDRTEPEITHHTEPPEQGGAPYLRAECCGAEVLGADENRIRHKDDCPTRMRIGRGSVLQETDSGKEFVVINLNADSVCAVGVDHLVEYEMPTRWIRIKCEVV